MFSLVDKHYGERVSLNAIKSNNHHNNKLVTDQIKNIHEKLEYFEQLGKAKKNNYGVKVSGGKKTADYNTAIDYNETNWLTKSDEDLLSDLESDTASQHRRMQKYLHYDISNISNRHSKFDPLKTDNDLRSKDGFFVSPKFNTYTPANMPMRSNTKIKVCDLDNSNDEITHIDYMLRNSIENMSDLDKTEHQIFKAEE